MKWDLSKSLECIKIKTVDVLWWTRPVLLYFAVIVEIDILFLLCFFLSFFFFFLNAILIIFFQNMLMYYITEWLSYLQDSLQCRHKANAEQFPLRSHLLKTMAIANSEQEQDELWVLPSMRTWGRMKTTILLNTLKYKQSEKSILFILLSPISLA